MDRKTVDGKPGYLRRESMHLVKKYTRKYTARNDRDHDEGSGMEVSERSFENEGLGMTSRERSTVMMTCRRMIFPCGDVKELYI